MTNVVQKLSYKTGEHRKITLLSFAKFGSAQDSTDGPGEIVRNGPKSALFPTELKASYGKKEMSLYWTSTS